MASKSEAATRRLLIDPKLEAAGWSVQPFDPDRSLAKYDRSAIEEYPTDHGPADYALCVGSMLWFSPWIGSYYYSLALWPAAALLGHILRHPTDPAAKRWAHRALLVWLFAMPAIGSQFLRACGVHTWATALLLLAVVLVHRRSFLTAPGTSSGER